MLDMRSPLVGYRRTQLREKMKGGALRGVVALIRREGALVLRGAPWSGVHHRAHIWHQLDSNLAGCESRTHHIASSPRPRRRPLPQAFLM